jgi:hypothetical protein
VPSAISQHSHDGRTAEPAGPAGTGAVRALRDAPGPHGAAPRQPPRPPPARSHQAANTSKEGKVIKFREDLASGTGAIGNAAVFVTALARLSAAPPGAVSGYARTP